MATPPEIPDEAVEAVARELQLQGYETRDALAERHAAERWDGAMAEHYGWLRDKYRKRARALLAAAYPILAAQVLRDNVGKARLIEYRRLQAHLGGLHFAYRGVPEYDTCAGCNQASSSWVPWPCPTWRLIESLSPAGEPEVTDAHQ